MFLISCIIVFELVALNTYFHRERILVIGNQYVNKQSQDFRYYWDRNFQTEVLSQWSRNMKKLLMFRFQQCFTPFNLLVVHECSDRGLFRHLDFRNKEKSWKNIFFLEIIAFELVASNTHFYRERILVIGNQYVNKESQTFRYYSERIFQTEFLSEWWKSMKKLLPCGFK